MQSEDHVSRFLSKESPQFWAYFNQCIMKSPISPELLAEYGVLLPGKTTIDLTDTFYSQRPKTPAPKDNFLAFKKAQLERTLEKFSSRFFPIHDDDMQFTYFTTPEIEQLTEAIEAKIMTPLPDLTNKLSETEKMEVTQLEDEFLNRWEFLIDRYKVHSLCRMSQSEAVQYIYNMARFARVCDGIAANIFFIDPASMDELVAQVNILKRMSVTRGRESRQINRLKLKQFAQKQIESDKKKETDKVVRLLTKLSKASVESLQQMPNTPTEQPPVDEMCVIFSERVTQFIDIILEIKRTGLSSIPQWNKNKEAAVIKELEHLKNSYYGTTNTTTLLTDRVAFGIRQLFAMVQLVQPGKSHLLHYRHEETQIALDLNDKDLAIIDDSFNFFDPIVAPGSSKTPQYSNVNTWRISKNFKLDLKRIQTLPKTPKVDYKSEIVSIPSVTKTRGVFSAWGAQQQSQILYGYFPSTSLPKGLLQKNTQFNEKKLKRVRDWVESLLQYPLTSPLKESTDLRAILTRLSFQVAVMYKVVPVAFNHINGMNTEFHMSCLLNTRITHFDIENDQYNIFNPLKTPSGIEWRLDKNQNLDPSMIVQVDSYTLRKELLKKEVSQKKLLREQQQVAQLTNFLESLNTENDELKVPPEQQEKPESDIDTNTEAGECEETAAKQRPEKEAKNVQRAIKRYRQKARHGRR